MKLYLNDISSATARVRIALALKGIQVDTAAVTILGEAPENRAAEYLRVNPQGLVPALLTDSGTLITQSLAIIEYLDEWQPQPPLLPADIEARALSRAVALAIAAEIHALVPPRVARQLAARAGMSSDAIAAWNRHWISEGMAAVEQLISARRSGPFIGGAQPSIADIVLFPQVVNTERMGIDLAQWPHIAEVYRNLQGIAAFAENAPAPRK